MGGNFNWCWLYCNSLHLGEIMDISNIVDRIKNLQKFIIVTPLPDEFEFNGPVPFDMRIKDGIVMADVWALTLDEATQRVNDYLNNA